MYRYIIIVVKNTLLVTFFLTWTESQFSLYPYPKKLVYVVWAMRGFNSHVEDFNQNLILTYNVPTTNYRLSLI